MTRVGVTRCLLAAVLFGASAPAASRLAGHVPTLVLAGLLYLGAALAVAPTALRRARPLRQLRAGGALLAVSVLFGGAVGPVLLVEGLQRIPAASASLLLNFELLATTVVAATFFHEHLGARFVSAAGLVAVAGALLVWRPGASVELGGLFIVGACVAWGIDNSVTARIDQLAPEQITFAKGVVGGTANLVLGALFTGTVAARTAQIPAALLVGAVGYGLSITLWVKGARDLGAARGQLIFATAPFVGAALSWLLLGDAVTPTQLVAAGLAATGVALSLRTQHAHRHRHDAVEHEHEHSHDDQHHTHGHTPPVAGRHTHRHRHAAVEHEHPHTPDLHHSHRH